jgi:hypothetical protein
MDVDDDELIIIVWKHAAATISRVWIWHALIEPDGGYSNSR